MPTATQKRKLTAHEARTFDHYSIANAAQAMRQLEEAGICDGTCEPYASIFTYNRWQALSFQVQKGQHGVKLSTFIENVKEEESGEVTTSRRPWTTTVFCRHQVEKKSSASVLQHASAK